MEGLTRVFLGLSCLSLDPEGRKSTCWGEGWTAEESSDRELIRSHKQPVIELFSFSFTVGTMGGLSFNCPTSFVFLRGHVGDRFLVGSPRSRIYYIDQDGLGLAVILLPQLH